VALQPVGEIISAMAVTLRAMLRGGPLPIRKAIDYALQIARGLEAAHEYGIHIAISNRKTFS
jgi:hypothetical protein